MWVEAYQKGNLDKFYQGPKSLLRIDCTSLSGGFSFQSYFNTVSGTVGLCRVLLSFTLTTRMPHLLTQNALLLQKGNLSED